MKHLAQHRERLQEQAPLAKYTAARLGGPADWLYVTRHDTAVEELIEVVQAAWLDGIPVRILGGGANVLISDSGFRGLVVVNRIAQMAFGDWVGGRRASVSAGLGLQIFARACAARGWTGMEWAVGVPGTIGGAIINNAGAHGADMAASVVEVVLYDAQRGPQMLDAADLEYAYRHSSLKARQDKRFLVLMANLHLERGDPADIRARMDEYNAYRKRTQPPGASLGSIFKNPPGDYAGRLIESCGLKGSAVGGVQVSPVHANFIVHTGGASASDYFGLIEHVRRTVAERTGIELELEIETLGDWEG